ncbi:DUF1275 family protein [Streptomyces xanthii]|uniref:DUF1275 family protein n=1 Tax=Streptomyces xanthii TaxID=2768069 RepID=A0A7H1B360_9ACTN|nr:DUF1275 family protein [Streptomyces xanthii]QNS03165.1 DUF1275 family protein [Streptomyces xanthii]
MNRRAHVCLVLLAGASGAVDGLAFTVLGTVFAGVMTGNLVLLGVSAGGGDAADVAAPLYALGGYALGAALAALVCRGAPARSGGGWPGRVVACLAGQAALLGFVAVVCAVLDGRPAGVWRTALLVVSALAMGGQSGAMVAAGASPTTYFTGTLTTLVTGLVDGSGRGAGQVWGAARLLAVAGGAACAVAVHRGAPVWAFVPPVVLTAAAVLCQKPAHRLRTAGTTVHENPLRDTHDGRH